MNFNRFLSLLTLLLPLSLHAAEASDSIVSIRHAQRVSIACSGHEIRLHVIPSEGQGPAFTRCMPVRSISANGQSVSTDSVSFTMPEVVNVSEQGDLIHIQVRQQADDARFSFTLTGVKPMADSSATGHEISTDNASQADDRPHCFFSDMRFRHDGKKNQRTGLQFGGAHVGFVAALGAPEGMDVSMGNSCEIGFEAVNYVWSPRSRKRHFSIGLNFNWRNYRMTGRSRFERDEQGNTAIAPYPDDATSIQSSRIKVFSVGIPFRYGFNLPHHWGIDIEAALRFNTYASIESHYKAFDTEENITHQVKEHYKDIHPNKVSVDLTTRIHWRALGLYATYSPCHVLNPSFGPRFSTFTTGFCLFY